MNETQDKMIKTSEKIIIFLNIVQVLIVTGIIIVTFAAFLLGLADDQLRTELMNGMQSITHGNYKFATFQLMSLLFLINIVSFGIWYYILKLMKNIFKTIVTLKTPFNDTSVDNIRNIAIASIVLSFIGGAIKTLENYFMFIEVDFSIDLFALVIGACIYCISLVFKFGVELQQLSDETL